jgi:hypothetical protein
MLPASGQGTLSIAGNHQKLGERHRGDPSEFLERVLSCQHLAFRLVVFITEVINICYFKPSGPRKLMHSIVHCVTTGNLYMFCFFFLHALDIAIV